MFIFSRNVTHWTWIALERDFRCRVSTVAAIGAPPPLLQQVPVSITTAKRRRHDADAASARHVEKTLLLVSARQMRLHSTTEMHQCCLFDIASDTRVNLPILDNEGLDTTHDSGTFYIFHENTLTVTHLLNPCVQLCCHWVWFRYCVSKHNKIINKTSGIGYPNFKVRP